LNNRCRSDLQKDLDLAEQQIECPGVTVAAVSDGEVLARSGGLGIGPLLDLLEEISDDTQNIVIADRIVGAAAALFLESPQIAAVYADVMSTPAKKRLISDGIYVQVQEDVSAILNRDETGLCPMEKIATSEGSETARKKILNIVTSNG